MWSFSLGPSLISAVRPRLHAIHYTTLPETATPEQLHALCESVYQVFKGSILLNLSEKDNLGEHEKYMIQLEYGYVPYKEKKIIFIQHGAGFVDTLLNPVITSLAYAML